MNVGFSSFGTSSEGSVFPGDVGYPEEVEQAKVHSNNDSTDSIVTVKNNHLTIFQWIIASISSLFGCYSVSKPLKERGMSNCEKREQWMIVKLDQTDDNSHKKIEFIDEENLAKQLEDKKASDEMFAYFGLSAFDN